MHKTVKISAVIPALSGVGRIVKATKKRTVSMVGIFHEDADNTEYVQYIQCVMQMHNHTADTNVSIRFLTQELILRED